VKLYWALGWRALSALEKLAFARDLKDAASPSDPNAQNHAAFFHGLTTTGIEQQRAC
jgi:hypothetical protein